MISSGGDIGTQAGGSRHGQSSNAGVHRVGTGGQVPLDVEVLCAAGHGAVGGNPGGIEGEVCAEDEIILVSLRAGGGEVAVQRGVAATGGDEVVDVADGGKRGVPREIQGQVVVGAIEAPDHVERGAGQRGVPAQRGR